MKKLLLFLAFIMGAVFTQAQSAQAVDRLQKKEMDALVKRVTYNKKQFVFTKNQTAKLETVFLNKAKEVILLREKEVPKGDYLEEYKRIQKKYEPQVEAVLTAVQKVEYRRNANKHIKKLKD